PAVVVHGGAGTRPDVDPAPYFAGTRRAAEAGLRVLSQGGSALDAAQAAAVVLEDDPMFNAGTGAALTSTGEVELDASCMDGTARTRCGGTSAPSEPLQWTRAATSPRPPLPAAPCTSGRGAWATRRSSARALTPMTARPRRAPPVSGKPS